MTAGAYTAEGGEYGRFIRDGSYMGRRIPCMKTSYVDTYRIYLFTNQPTKNVNRPTFKYLSHSSPGFFSIGSDVSCMMPLQIGYHRPQRKRSSGKYFCPAKMQLATIAVFVVLSTIRSSCFEQSVRGDFYYTINILLCIQQSCTCISQCCKV